MIKHLIDMIMQKMPFQVMVATVESVDKSSCACDLTMEDHPERSDVRLRAVIDNDDTGMIVFPKEGSKVLVACIDNKPESSYILATSEIDEVYINIPQTEMSITDEGFLLKRSSNNLGGLISDLIDAILQLTVTTGTGPSGTPINAADFIAIQQKFSQLLKTG